MKRAMEDRQIEQHTITAEALHELLLSNREVLIFDIRLPLDLLAHTEMISGAKRIAPQAIILNPSLIPKDRDSVVYCTCPDEKTSRAIIRRALGMSFFRMKLLKGGLEAWKARGYPVEAYQKVFHLYTPSLTHFL
jgi:rhodanese-related sulfurtransferase